MTMNVAPLHDRVLVRRLGEFLTILFARCNTPHRVSAPCGLVGDSLCRFLHRKRRVVL